MLEFFAGIGLIHEALRATRWECGYANDLDPHKQAMYEAHFGKASSSYWHLGDVWETAEVMERLPDRPFLATASFPCTDMSLAGQMQGFAGRESSAFFGFAQVLEELGDRKPPMVMLENVVGLMTARGGEDFRAAARRLAELGYWLDAFRLDARHFVPQSRPRLFLLGWQCPPAPAVNAETLLTSSSTLRPDRLLSLMQSTPLATGWRPQPLPAPPQCPTTLADVIDLDNDQAWWEPAQVERHRAMLSERHAERIEAWRSEPESQVGTGYRRIRAGQQRLEVRFDGIAGCLRTPKGGSARQIIVAHTPREGLRMRWMSPREYARLQGAANFCWGELADSRVLFGFGDAVCVPAIAWIDQHVLTPYYEARCQADSVG